MGSMKIPANLKKQIEIGKTPSALHKSKYSRVLLLGPTSSGKSLLSRLLAKHIVSSEGDNFKSIGMGSLFRDMLKRLGMNVTTGGKLLDDNIAWKILNKELAGMKNFILEGFPKTSSQVKKLKDSENLPDIIFNLKISRKGTEKINEGRLNCQNSDCKKIYHEAIKELEPKIDNKCCDKPLKRRGADHSPKTFREKREVFDKNIKPIINKFKKLGKEVIDINITEKGARGGKIREVRDVLAEMISVLKAGNFMKREAA